MRALEAQPATLIHGDLKLANVGIAADGSVEVVDWQMVMVAPVAIELGWFLVSNVNALPLAADAVLERYRGAGGLLDDAGADLAILVGLLLRGWRKGSDADAGITLASGVAAADDLAWWCDRAVEAAGALPLAGRGVDSDEVVVHAMDQVSFGWPARRHRRAFRVDWSDNRTTEELRVQARDCRYAGRPLVHQVDHEGTETARGREVPPREHDLRPGDRDERDDCQEASPATFVVPARMSFAVR